MVVAHLAAKLYHVLALDPGQVIGELESVSILRFRTLIERGAGQAAYPDQAKSGKEPTSNDRLVSSIPLMPASLLKSRPSR
jgi:hypothetical protein